MSRDAFNLYFAELAKDYRRELPAKLAELDRLWDSLSNGMASSEQISELHRELHTLVGTARTMGLPAVTDAARAAETWVASFLELGVAPGPAGREDFGRLLAELKQSAGIES